MEIFTEKAFPEYVPANAKTLGNVFSPDFIKLLENDSRNRFFYCTCIFSALFYKCMCGKVVTNVRTHHTSTMSDILLYFCENTVGFRAAFDAVVKDGLCEMLFKRSVNVDGIFTVGIVYPYVYRLG